MSSAFAPCFIDFRSANVRSESGTLRAKHTILFEQIPKDISLLAIQPPDEESEQQLERGGIEHGGSLHHGPQVLPSPPIQSWDTTGAA